MSARTSRYQADRRTREQSSLAVRRRSRPPRLIGLLNLEDVFAFSHRDLIVLRGIVAKHGTSVSICGESKGRLTRIERWPTCPSASQRRIPVVPAWAAARARQVERLRFHLRAESRSWQGRDLVDRASWFRSTSLQASQCGSKRRENMRTGVGLFDLREDFAFLEGDLVLQQQIIRL